MKSRRILQIMPDTRGMYAVFDAQDGEGVYNVPLVGWALVELRDDEAENGTTVCGLIFDDAGEEAYPIIDDSWGFLRYECELPAKPKA